MRRMRIVMGACLALVVLPFGARAQMERPEWVDDVKWHATVGTGMSAETGGAVNKDPLLLYFGGNVKKSWRWWYGLTYKARVNFFAGIAECPMVPYRLDAETHLGMGAPVFQMMVIRARFETEFAGFCFDNATYSTGKNLRLKAGTLPSFGGDVKLLDGQHILTYFGSPLQVVFGRYPGAVFTNASDFSWKPYTGGELSLGDRIILTEWAQLHGKVSFFKAWSNQELRLFVDVGVAIGILQNAVQFGLDVLNDTWLPPDPTGRAGVQNVNTITLSARLKI